MVYDSPLANSMLTFCKNVNAPERMQSVERKQGAAAGPARTTRMWLQDMAQHNVVAGHGSTQVYDRSWIIRRTWLQLLAHILHIIWDLESWFNRKNLHHRGERWGSMLSPCVDTTMKAQAMLITSLGFCFKQNPDCQVSKCKSSLVYSSHNAYYRKWNRLTYILRHEHMYTTFHRNYVYSPFSS